MIYPCRAVLMLGEDDVSSAASDKPLMLETVLFCPILRWMADKLQADGVQRFFIVCDSAYEQEVRACFPAEADVTVSQDRVALEAFLAEDGLVAVFPCAELPLSREGEDSYAYAAQAAVLQDAWYGGKDLSGHTPLDGWTAVYAGQRLQELELACRSSVVERHLQNGVRIMDSASVYIDPRVEIGRGTCLLPGTILKGESRIGMDCEIGPNAVLNACALGDGVIVNASQINESTLADGCDVGPYAHIRPGCTLGPKCHIGAFVQLKNCVLGEGTKMAHLTYVGDADVGARVNFGCGTITTNYDGFRKHRCTVEDDAFIGCNANLVSPVRVGAGAYVAAGTTVTQDIPAGALAVGRARQENKDGWAARRREQHKKSEM